LDWAKAFDSLAPDRLFTALVRFGIKNEMVSAISGVNDWVSQARIKHGNVSSRCGQRPEETKWSAALANESPADEDRARTKRRKRKALPPDEGDDTCPTHCQTRVQ